MDQRFNPLRPHSIDMSLRDTPVSHHDLEQHAFRQTPFGVLLPRLTTLQLICSYNEIPCPSDYILPISCEMLPNELEQMAHGKTHSNKINDPPSLSRPFLDDPSEMRNMTASRQNLEATQQDYMVWRPTSYSQHESHKYLKAPSSMKCVEAVTNTTISQPPLPATAIVNKKQNRATTGSSTTTGCTCKKTQCLKMYCECFATGGFCGKDCVCLNCANKESNLEAIKNARKTAEQRFKQTYFSPVDGTVKRRCHCKKTKCQKKYCECYNQEVGCNELCQCEGCENRKPTRGSKELPLIV